MVDYLDKWSYDLHIKCICVHKLLSTEKAKTDAWYMSLIKQKLFIS